MSSQPGIVVFLAMRNGQPYLNAQLESIASQTLPPMKIIVGDDGSNDGSVDVLEQFSRRWKSGEVVNLLGPQKGFAANFLALLNHADPESDFVFLCDQDDVWLPRKIEYAVEMLGQIRPNQPALYGSRRWFCDAELKHQKLSAGLVRPTGFQHAVAQNFAGGNTMALNRAALSLVQKASRRIGDIPLHDWWLYQLISGCGGVALFDDRPMLLYRQHKGNQIGANVGVCATWHRVKHMLAGQYRRWNTANLTALNEVSDMLRPDARAMVDQVIAARMKPLFSRILAFRRLGLYRQGWVQQLGFWVAIILNRY